MTETKWENYGDVNPLEHGGFWIKKVGVDPCYYVIEWHPTTSNVGLMTVGYVDLSDSWIDWKAVVDYADLHDESTDEEKVRALFDYYGAKEFNGEDRSMRTTAARELLKEHGIEV